MARPDKYGSPYDPRNGGKIRREEEKSQQAQEPGILGPGCGNPECPMCYPESSMRSPFFTRSRSVPMPTVSLRGSFEREIANSLRESMAAQIRGSFSMGMRADWGFSNPGAATSAEPASPAPPRPPQSYRDAREEVERYIVAAPEQAFDDIVGNAEALDQLRDAIEAPVKHKALYDAYGMKMPKGALLSGPPGCGKTMFARAAASEMRRLYGDGSEFISISGSELQSKFIGETEERIKAIFTYAREYKAFHGHPLLVFMDEAEVLLPDRTGRVRRVMSWEESQVATFLAGMDGMQESGAFVLLATNRPEVIDQAVLRDGRCDFKITIARPTMEALDVILRRAFAGTLLVEGCTVDDVAFAALETFCDPNKVILEAHMIGIDFEKEKVHRRDKHFLFEHIVSGAMAASIPARATRRAFARDKTDGVARGVTVDDVVQSVTTVFEENKGLEHSFALGEFRKTFLDEAKESIKREQSADRRDEAA